MADALTGLELVSRPDLGVDVARLLGLTPSEKRTPTRTRQPVVLVRPSRSLLAMAVWAQNFYQEGWLPGRSLAAQDKSQQQLTDDALDSLRRWLLTKGAHAVVVPVLLEYNSHQCMYQRGVACETGIGSPSRVPLRCLPVCPVSRMRYIVAKTPWA